MLQPSPQPSREQPLAVDSQETASQARHFLLAATGRFLRSRNGVAGGSVLLILTLVAVASGYLAPFDPLAPDAVPLQGPGLTHPFGTDELGRDILSRVIHGTRDALLVAVSTASLATLIGVPIGLLSGYLGRWVDALLMRVVDVVLALPTIIVVLLVVAILGPGMLNMIIAIAVSASPKFARLARASTLQVKAQEYVLAARAAGASVPDILVRTVLPNILAPIIVQFVVTASLVIVYAASLNFLGLGTPPPAPTWGGMLQTARGFLDQSPWYGVLPGIALFITIAAFDAVGRGLESALGSRADDRLQP